MVIQPIEKMVDAVTRLAANPAYKLEAVQEVRDETDALYASLIKIASLLQVGFGEVSSSRRRRNVFPAPSLLISWTFPQAGNNLVAENLKKGVTATLLSPPCPRLRP